MQSSINSTNSRFLEDYRRVLCHHINCILKSCMILDEDMQLVTTFWVPNLVSKKSFVNHFTVASVTSAMTGLFISIRLHHFYPFTICATPAAIQLCNQIKSYYYEKKYKRNFEKLINLIRELYELNRSILEHYQKKSVATQDHKIPDEIYVLLLQPGREFLKHAISTLIGVLEKLKASMFEVCQLVPITEGDYVYCSKWNLDDFKKYDDTNFEEMQHHFEKLSDLYLLMISNFLSCVGLSLCVQLWKEVCCNFQSIFNNLIPGLCRFLESSLNDIKTHFDCVRFTLPSVDDGISQQQLNYKLPNSPALQLQRPLTDFLTNLQVTFESAKQMQLLINRDNSKTQFEYLLPIVEDLSNQLAVCEVSLDALVRLLYMLTKRSLTKDVNPVELPIVSKESVLRKEIRFDDSEELLEDEEYNLSIHGSDDEDSVEAIYDYADQCSTEHLELMLYELKRKLNERKSKMGKIDEQPQAVIENNVPKSDKATEQALPPLSSNKIPPIPPPPIMMHRLPAVDNSHLGFLDAVKSVAQNLNRSEEFQFGFNMFPEIPRPFNTTYRCFSVAMLPGNERQDVERGGKIIMPPSALEQLTRLNINYPMLFKIVNKNTNRTTHCGVLEFVADEGKVYLPLWMMHNLVLEEGDLIQIESVSLPVGTFAKFQPLSPDFLDITNPKAVLENCLRTFACLTSGDVIAVKYNQRVYELCVLETQPGNAISIIECDMNVEFAAPVGYKESEVVKQSEEDMVVDPADLMPEPSGFVAFRGTGNRLDGKRRKDSGPSDTSQPKPVYVRGIPDYDYQIGTLRFLRHFTKSPVSNKEEEENGEFKAFSGEGFSLKRRN